MPPPQTTFSTGDICRLLRCSRRFVTNSIATGKLRAIRRPSAGRSVANARYVVARDELIRWLMTGHFDPHVLRSVLNHSPVADAVLVRTRPSLQAAMNRRGPTLRVDSLFALGRTIHQRQTWVVVVDLNEVGATEAARSLSALSRLADRPELVGLVDGDYSARPETAEVFDVLLPLSRSDDSIAAAITGLRRENRT